MKVNGDSMGSGERQATNHDRAQQSGKRGDTSGTDAYWGSQRLTCGRIGLGVGAEGVLDLAVQHTPHSLQEPVASHCQLQPAACQTLWG